MTLTLIDQEGVVSGHLIGRTSPGGLMNIHGAVTFQIVRLLPNLRFLREASHWSIVIISTLPNSLTESRGEYLRVVGIHSDG